MDENNQSKTEKRQTWWQKSKQSLMVIGVIILVLLIAFVVAVLKFGWDWTGFNSATGPILKSNEPYRPAKTLWDVLQLLIIPIILAIGGFWLNQIQKSREEKATEERTRLERKAAEKREEIDRGIAIDNQHAAALQAYINNMSELLLEKNLHQSKPEDDIRKIARAQTLTVLTMLGIRRKRSVLQFLYESNLISKDHPIINLDEADIRDALLRDIILKKAMLRGAYLYGADLRDADLQNTNLQEAKLNNANLINADLRGVDLTNAILSGAKVTNEQLAQAASLKDATMPDGSVHP